MIDPATPLRSPYVGLQPYTQADIDYFFGRERDQRIIAANLGAARLTILYGASGVGKSSVLLAGVAPYLLTRPRTAVAVVRDWQGADFLEALKSECGEAIERVLQRPLSLDPRLPLDDFLCAAGSELRGSLVIIFDQFEEYFLYHPESETGQTFDAELARAVNRDDIDAAFLISLREDGLAKLDRFGGRIPNLLGNTLRIQHLTAADAEAAIRKPLDVFNDRHADAAPVAIEDGLVSAVIDQVRSGQVTLGRSGGVGQADKSEEAAYVETPFLQLVMTRLWEVEINAGSHTLRLASLERLGGAEQIVRMHLDEVMDGLDGAQQEVCAKFFDRLVTPSGTKIACSLSDLTVFAGPDSGEVAPILETLCATRILRGVTSPGANRPSDTSYEIYHDVLAPAILDWRRGYLQAQERAEDDRRAAEQARADAKAAYTKRLRILYAGLGVLATVAGLLGLWVFQLGLQEAASKRQAHARELAYAAKNAFKSDPELGTLLAIESVQITASADRSVTDAAAAVLQEAVRTPQPERRLLGLPGAPLGMFFSPDGTRLTAMSLEPGSWIRDVASRLTVPVWRPTTMVWDIGSGSTLSRIADDKAGKVVEISPNGQWAATISSDGSVTVLDVVSRKVSTVEHDKVSSAHFSLDGQWLATRSSDGTVKISATSSGQVRFTIDNHRGIEINAFALSPDATRLATSSRKDQKTQTVTVLDCGTDVKILDKPVPGGLITALTFSPDGKRLVTLAREQPNDDNVRVWDMESGDSSLANGHYDTVAFSPHGNLLAGAGQDRLVHLWTISNAGDVKPLRTLFGQSAPVLNVIFSPTSSRIAAASADGTARIWDVQSGRDLLSIRSAAKVAFGADGTHLASAGRDGPVSIWDIDSRAAAAASRVALSPDGDLLATSGSDEAVRIWHWDSRHPSHTLGSKLGSMYNLAFSPDGSRFVTVNTAGQATIWNLKDFHTERSFSVHPKDWVTLAWLDEKTIVTADASGTAEVRDPTNDNPPSVFGTPREVAASALSADGRHLAVVSLNHDKVEIWEDGRKDPSWSIPAGGVKFRDIALSPNGQYIAAISETGRMQLWDLTSNKLLTLPAADLGDEGLTAQSGLAFSPDGTHLATAHAEAVELWDFANKSNPEFIDTESVNILAFSRDGRRLATASRDGTFQVWPLDLEDRITLARALTTRSVKEEECKRYHVEPCPKSR